MTQKPVDDEVDGLTKIIWQWVDESQLADTFDIPALKALLNAHYQKKYIRRWWIATDFFHNGGRKVMGPFESQELALRVRSLLENNQNHRTYAVDEALANMGEIVRWHLDNR